MLGHSQGSCSVKYPKNRLSCWQQLAETFLPIPMQQFSKFLTSPGMLCGTACLLPCNNSPIAQVQLRGLQGRIEGSDKVFNYWRKKYLLGFGLAYMLITQSYLAQYLGSSCQSPNWGVGRQRHRSLPKRSVLLLWYYMALFWQISFYCWQSHFHSWS